MYRYYIDKMIASIDDVKTAEFILHLLFVLIQRKIVGYTPFIEFVLQADTTQ